MVGASIVRELKRQGYQNLIYRTHGELELTKQEAVEKFFDEERPEYVFLAAAKVGGIKANAEFPADFLMENLQLQNNVLQCAYKYHVKKLLFLGSSCIYPKECKQPMKEEGILTGALEPTNEAYSIAKITGMKACHYYNHQYNTKFISAIPANCYGIDDCFDLEKSHVIPALILKFHEAKRNHKDAVVLWGTGTPLREFLFVDDLAKACVFLMNEYEKEEFLNIGTGSELSILELSQLIKEIVGFRGEIIWDITKPDGMMRRMVDSTNIHKIGWSAKTPLERGLRIVYQWFLKE